VIIAGGFQFPEGPAFARDGTLYLVNLEGGYISRVPPGGQPEVFHPTGGRPNGLAIHKDGSLYVADSGLRAVLRVDPETKEQQAVAGAFRGRPFNGPNDLCFGPDGTLFFTDPLHSSAENPIGKVYRLTPAGRLSVVLDGLAFPNGLCLSEDASILYLAETKRHRILRCRLDAAGRCREWDVYAQVEGGPDGMALDLRGNLYVALYGRGAVGVIPPGGGSVTYLPVDGPRPTNVAFHGERLYVTEAATGTLQVLSIGVPGLPLYSHR